MRRVINKSLIVAVPFLVIGGCLFVLFFSGVVDNQYYRSRIARNLKSAADRFRTNPQDRESLEEIRAVLKGGTSFGKTYAYTVLGDLGPLASETLPDLISALNCGDPLLEREAARALGTVGKNSAMSVPFLIRKLAGGEPWDAACFSAESLGEIGAPAKTAIPELTRASKSDDESLAYSATQALKKLSH